MRCDGSTQVSSLAGESELSSLLEVVSRHPLVTVTGAPGIGKSHLALQVANRLSATEALATKVVHVAALADANQLSAAVAQARQPVLVVLDDCDHLVAACAQAAESLMAATGVRVLATSREPLRIPGEVVWQAAPLSLPEAGCATLPEALVDSQAVQLFCDRSTAVARGFSPTPDNIAAIVEICRRLDGLPLAIELVAARSGVLSPAEIVARLDHPLRLLTRPAAPRTAEPRHQSLRAALEWSWDVLAPPEQSLLGRLSVFAGSFTAEAAAHVGAGDEAPTEDSFDVLCALVGKSLVVAETVGHRTRYRLFGVIRHFAAEQLAKVGEADDVAARHSGWYTELIAQAGDDRRQEWVELLEPEHDEILAAFRWTAAHGRADAATRLGRAGEMLSRVRGDDAQARALLEQVLLLADDLAAPVRANLLYYAGSGATSGGDFGLAKARLQASMAASHEAGDATLVVRAQAMSAFVSVLAGDVAAGFRTLDEAVDLARSTGDPDCLAEALGAYARAHLLVGDVAPAHRAFSEIRDSARGGANDTVLANALQGLGATAAMRGDYQEAEQHLREALRMGDVAPHAAAMTVACLGELARLQGDDEAAEALFLECLRRADETAVPYPGGKALVGLGRVAQGRGDLDDARRRFDDALSLARAQRLTHLVSPCLHGLAQLARAAGAQDSARSLLEEARASARTCVDKAAEAQALDELARMAAAGSEHRRAETLHHRALALRDRIGDPAEIADSLEGLGALRASSGELAGAARLLGAAQSLREHHGCIRLEPHLGDYNAAVALARHGLGPDCFDAGWWAGMALSTEEAVGEASPPGRKANRPSSGPEALTPAEREVAALAAAGLTSEAIGRQLLVSRRTVETHLQRAYSKLGIRSRRELDANICA